MRIRLFGEAADTSQVEDGVPGLRRLMSEAVYGGIWARPGLALGDRMVCTLAALCAVQRLRRHAAAALDIGVEARAILEIFIQCAIYAGFPATEEAIAVAAAVFAERGISIPAKPPRRDTLEELSRRARRLLEELHRERGSEGYAAPDNPVTGALYPLAIQYGYGEIWHRPGLDRRRRALCAVAAFTALRLEGQVRKFGQSALNAGLGRGEIIEAVIQTGPFSGLAPALNALAALSDAAR
jgi:4-carboxymuconolactone decarboxylase